MDDLVGFESWYRSLALDFGDSDDADQRSKYFEQWCRHVYEAEGPLPIDLVDVAFGLDILRLTTENVAVVENDIRATTDLTPEIVVDECDGGIRVAFYGSYSSPSVSAWENPEALAETADYLQEHVIRRLGHAWPVCPNHPYGAHVGVRDGIAWWWCRRGEHGLARIGDLGRAGAG